MTDIKAKTKEFPNGHTISYDIPDTFSAFVGKYGEEYTLNLATAKLEHNVQSIVRQNIEKSTAEVQALVDAWVPGTRTAGAKKSPLERASAALAGMSADDLAALLEKVRAAKKHAG